MAETTFKSAGVTTREIDLSGPSSVPPTGIPAGVIGTSLKGRAFVPITLANYQNFVAEFGKSDATKFGPIAMSEWLRNANSGLYIRILGVGDGKKRIASTEISSSWGGGVPSDGGVKNAGFVVGQRLPQANGNIGVNAYAGTGLSGAPYGTTGGALGRTFLLGAFMSESAGSDIFSQAGLSRTFDSEGVNSVSGSYTILRGVLMAPSGVIPTLSSAMATQNTPVTRSMGNFYGFDGDDSSNPSACDGGSWLGTVNVATNARKDFVMLLNGHLSAPGYPNLITASFDPTAPNYFASAFNTDPEKLEQAGHLLYSHYDISTAYAVVTGSGTISGSDSTFSIIGSDDAGTADPTNKTYQPAAFLVTSSVSRNENIDSTNIPNFENFNDRFSTAFSPFVISQQFGGVNKNLFRVHATSDGTVPGGKTQLSAYTKDGKVSEAGSCAQFKISILNIEKSTSAANPYGEFDLWVRTFDDTDKDPVILEKWTNLNLDPTSENYIARIIGDQRLFYDFDKNDGSQKLVLEGSYPNMSAFVRIEVDNSLTVGTMEPTALPVGNRGPWHLVTSGSSIVHGYATTGSVTSTMLRHLNQPPLPMRITLNDGTGINKTAQDDYFWGFHGRLSQNVSDPNKSLLFNDSLVCWTKYFPKYHSSQVNVLVGDNEGKADVGGTVLDADKFCNNIFTLERVQVITGSGDLPDANLWASASYRRSGSLDSDIANSRFLDPSKKDFSDANVRRYLKYSFFIQAGFDGVCIFNQAKADLTDNAAKREMDDATLQGATNGPTVAAYRKAIDIISEKSDADIKLLAIPGARDVAISDYALDAVENRFDALYIMDIEERDQLNTVVTASAQNTSITNTITDFQNRNMDSSFGAAYFPDVQIRDPADSSQIVQVPPSVAVLGAFSLNDAIAHPWFAPAGFTRGVMANVTETQEKLDKAQMDALYGADINPLAAFPDTPGVVIWGQKTLLAAQSALDRVNVRRLLIEIRRQVKLVGDTLLFEPNRASTLARFSSAVNPILSRIQQQQGLDRFKVIIDTTTTTQADVENNTIRGKIFLQPTRSLEFISLDFVVTNAGTEV